MEPVNNELPTLPPEVLQMIFDQLEEPKDLLNAMRTCTQWEDALETRKSVILLQNVFPLIAKYLPVKSQLSCRQVCKPLKTTIDNLVERNSDVVSELDNFLRDRCDLWIPSQKATDFFSKMESFPGNPFIGTRFVRFWLPEQNGTRKEAFDTIFPLLIKFGSHLRKMIVDFSTTKPWISNPSETFHCIGILLGYVENLEFFKIVRGSFSRDKSVSNFLERGPFPPLRNLRSLHYGCYSVEFGLSLLQAYGHQLTSFTCGEGFFEDDGVGMDAMNKLMPNLKSFHVYGPRSFSYGVLRKLGHCSWPLQILEINLENEEDDDVNDVNNCKRVVNDFLMAMNRFKNTLIRLTLDTDLCKHGTHFGRTAKVEMPRLEFLETTISNVELLKFKCKNLTELRIQDAEMNLSSQQREELESYIDKDEKSTKDGDSEDDFEEDGESEDPFEEFEKFERRMLAARKAKYTRDNDLVERLFRTSPKLKKIEFYIGMDLIVYR